VRERRKGPISRAAGLAEGVAATMRRIQRDREPRVLLYDETGYARLLQPQARGHERVLELGDDMVRLLDDAAEDSRTAARAARKARRAG
jgi:hypothetical protein